MQLELTAESLAKPLGELFAQHSMSANTSLCMSTGCTARHSTLQGSHSTSAHLTAPHLIPTAPHHTSLLLIPTLPHRTSPHLIPTAPHHTSSLPHCTLTLCIYSSYHCYIILYFLLAGDGNVSRKFELIYEEEEEGEEGEDKGENLMSDDNRKV